MFKLQMRCQTNAKLHKLEEKFILTMLYFSLPTIAFTHDMEVISHHVLSIYNHFHNILRLFDVLPNFPFTTSETMGDYYL